MPEHSYKYIIVGAGLAGSSAIEGIRGLDKNGSILLLGTEKHLPYDRPPLTKKLWFGKKKVEDIFLHKKEYYDQNGVTLGLGFTVLSLDIRNRSLIDNTGTHYNFEKILLATGGVPRKLSIEGGDREDIYYFRNLNHYLDLRSEAAAGKSAVIVGGGFIGSEIAASLNINKLDVTMIFPGSYLVSRVFPEYLGRALQGKFQERGITILSGERPAWFRKKGNRFVTATETGREVESDIVIAGVGISPSLELARKSGTADRQWNHR